MSLRLDQLHGSLADPLLDSMTFLNEITGRHPEAISFAPGRPYEGFFETDRVAEYLDAYLDHLRERGLTEEQVRSTLFQYGPTKGIVAELIARTLANDEGLTVAPPALVVTVGAQEGMLLVLRALCADRDDVLLVSSPCYVGVTGAARLLDISTVPVPEGDPAAVAAAARALRAEGRRPRALYVVPDFANPSGVSLPTAVRRELLATARAEGLLVIEDNPYGFFTRTGRTRPTLKALDRHQVVVHLGSFAKTCFPGARLGYVLADQQVVAPDGSVTLLADQLAKLKSMTTVNTPALSQAVIGGLLIRYDFRLRAANATAVAHYAAGLTTLLAELEQHFPAAERARLGVGWNEPEGGYFTVLTVPFRADAAAMRRCAEQYGVLWTPMADFYPAGGGEYRLRLSSSSLTTGQIGDGIKRLAAFIREEAE
ncbi:MULTISPECIES: PLP-dependent aminotransferase family protein [unclassified Kitasatospora]|uniref:aminotransferase-like domain-containing protein n=1 Tax=unclassified Kitasatospora TaxID=2633591 RepID=UPI00070A9338|nr:MULTISPECIES: PLP-dependent aminotransferase family protein [unclassified Kitasatospora]KQV12064.1 GntR family transcriptional regulator [Kitasatospora sp. Root107]KRB72606.1 GntR family transcriptional regulator [Kitasatospora sp. Root187]